MDRLEKYVQANRQAFDSEEVDGRVWQKINQGLEGDRLEGFIRKHREALDRENPPEHLWTGISAQLDGGQSLEENVRSHREDLDEWEVPIGLWGRLSEKLEKEEQPETDMRHTAKVVPLKLVWRYAAAVALLVAALLVVQHRYLTQQGGQPEVIAEQATDDSPNLVSLRETEAYYTTLIDQKKATIRQYAQDNPQLFADFQGEIEQLDSMYQVMKTELQESQGSDRVITAMIENLQLRIDILNQQLNILEKIEAYKNDTDDRISI